MTKAHYARLIAQALTAPDLQPDELSFLHTLHLRLLASGEQAKVSGGECIRAMGIISTLRIMRQWALPA